MTDRETDHLENEMDDEASSARPHASWGAALTCSALVLLVVAGGLLGLREQVTSRVKSDSKAERVEREKLMARIDSLQGALDGVSGSPKPDSAALDALSTKIADLGSKLDALSARVEMLEKKPEPTPVATAVPAPAPAPKAASAASQAELTALKLAVLSGKPFAGELATWASLHPQTESDILPLMDFAPNGLVSETELQHRLRDALAARPETTSVEDGSTAGQINAHLKGLVRIQKTTSTDAYARLRKDVLAEDVAVLLHEVEALDEADRAPLAAWLKEAHSRNAALEALAKLTPDAGR